MSDEIERRLTELEGRLQRLEDEREITRLLTAYGPLVDSGNADAVADLWEPDGVYDVDERLMVGREQIEAMVRGENHQGFIANGCAHFLGPAHVSVDGDEAVAVCHSLMVLAGRGDFQFQVRRATANHFKLRRGPRGWRVQIRTSRVLDGREESPQLLGSGVRTAEGGAAAPTRAGARGSDAVLDRLHRLQRAIDGRDWDSIRATFTPGATGYGATGIDAIEQVMRAHLGGCGPTQHLLGNPLVTVEGDRATSRAYARVYHQGAGSHEGAFYEALGEYEDRWVLLEGEWRLEYRRFDTRIHLGDFSVLQPAER